jgi:uncharacterized protein (TIGR02118 family)
VLKVITLRDAAPPAIGWPQPGLCRLEVSAPLDEEIPGTPPGRIAGEVECAWFEDEPALLAAHGTRSLAGWIASGPVLRLVTREHVIFPVPDAPVPETGVRMISFFRRATGMSAETFESYWRLRHGPIVGRTPRLRRYVQSHLVPEHRESSREPFCDGVTEIWFDSLDDFRTGWNSPAVQEEQVRDCANFISSGVLHAVLRTRSARNFQR